MVNNAKTVTIVNLNDEVRFNLTPHGEDCLREYFTNLFKYDQNKQHIEDTINLYKIKDDGYRHTQLWDLFQVFGSYVAMGYHMVFTSTDLEVMRSE